jgi:hypothetical protein
MPTGQVWKGDKNPGIMPVPAAQPTSGKVGWDWRDWGFPDFYGACVLTAARVPITDAGASGSFGSLLLGTFPLAKVRFSTTSQNYTAFAEGSALTGGAGDLDFDIGVGSAAVGAAADGTLATTSINIGGATLPITLSGGTGTADQEAIIDLMLDGTGTAVSVYLNVSGSAATADASSYLDVTGTIYLAGHILK